MATSRKRSSTTSESGAYMSQYDQEVEVRLKALEEKAHTPCAGGASADGDRLAALEKRLEEVVAALKMAAPGSTKHL